MWKFRELGDKIANVVMNYTEVEAKVREATNDETWGPHGSLMQEIAKFTYTYEHFPEVMAMTWKRLLESNPKNWRRVYKALLLLAYLLRNGSERVVSSARDHLYDMRPLEDFQFRDERGKDQGINVRQKAKDLIGFIQDDAKIREERKKAKKARDKYVGVSSNDFQGRYGDYADEPKKKGRDKGRDRYDEYDEDLRRDSRRDRHNRYDTYDNDDEDSAYDGRPKGGRRVRKQYKDEESGDELAVSKEEEEIPRRQPVPAAAPAESKPLKLVQMSGAAQALAQPANEPADPFGQFTAGRAAPAPALATGPADFAAFQFATPAAAPAPAPVAAPAPASFDAFADFQSAPAPVANTQSAAFAGFQSAPAPAPAPAQPAAPSSQPLSAIQIMQQQQAFMQPEVNAPAQQPLMQQSAVDMSPQPTKSTLWSGASVDISLDFLSPNTAKGKAQSSQPSMNQLAQQIQPLPNQGMNQLTSGMGSVSLGGGGGMQPPQQQRMGMGMGMGMMRPPMGMASPQMMGPGMGMGGYPQQMGGGYGQPMGMGMQAGGRMMGQYPQARMGAPQTFSGGMGGYGGGFQ
eukprot:m.13336 g.13336  ORF g.13336 m.13336 type:complete len:573 (+) comp24694_c0_seq1:95-1813(+)